MYQIIDNTLCYVCLWGKLCPTTCTILLTCLEEVHPCKTLKVLPVMEPSSCWKGEKWCVLRLSEKENNTRWALALHSFPSSSIPLAFGSVQVINYQKEKIALHFRLYKKSTTIQSTQLKCFGHSQWNQGKDKHCKEFKKTFEKEIQNTSSVMYAPLSLDSLDCWLWQIVLCLKYTGVMSRVLSLLLQVHAL